jgi:hypothetical protein
MLDASASTHLSLSLSLFCQGSRGCLAVAPSRQAPLCGGTGRAWLLERSSPVVEWRVASASVFSAIGWSCCGIGWSGKSGCHCSHTYRVVASWGISSCADPAHGAPVQCSVPRCDGVSNPRSHRRLTHVVPEWCRGASPNRALRCSLPEVTLFPACDGVGYGCCVQRRDSDRDMSGSRRSPFAREKCWLVKERAATAVSCEWCLPGFGMEVERASGNCLSGGSGRLLRERRGER